MPAGQEIGDSGPQQPRSVHRILEAYGGDRAQVRQEVGAVMASKARGLAAAEAQRADGSIQPRQRYQGRTLQVGASGKQQVMVRPHERPQPGFVQGRQLRCQSHQRIDEEDLLELVRALAARKEQVANLMLRVEQHDADGVE